MRRDGQPLGLGFCQNRVGRDDRDRRVGGGRQVGAQFRADIGCVRRQGMGQTEPAELFLFLEGSSPEMPGAADGR